MSIDASAPFEAATARSNALGALIGRARRLLADRSDTAVAQKAAGGAFLIRIVNAVIAFASQILLARWMGDAEYGVYVYVWTWVLLLGGTTSLGLASAPQRFIPEYAESGQHGLLRGFLLGSRLMAMATSTVIAAIGLAGIWLFSEHLNSWAVVPLYLAMVCIPLYVLTDVQDGISRTYNWIDVALAPAFFVRPILILLLLGALSSLSFAPTATTAMAATIVATWATALAQLAMLERRLKTKTVAAPRAYAPKTWMKVSLPIFMVEGFYLLLAYTDVIVLSAFREPHEVGVYYAAVKVMSLVAFVSFSVSAAVAHRFTEYAVAGDREKLSTMVIDAARWTFWPSLGGSVIVLALGWPILWLFGENFTAGYPLLFVIAIGLLARASVGPLERLLNMLGEQNLCAGVYASAFVLNIALCVLLVPAFGAMGAAAATASTLVIETVILFTLTRRRLGLGALPWTARQPYVPREVPGDAMTAANALPLDLAAPIERQAVSPLDFRLVTIAELGRSHAAWDDLAARALEPNLFCEADFAIPASAIKAVGGADKVRIATVWDGDRLMAAAAVVTRGAPPIAAMLSTTPWAFFGALGAPLLDAGQPVRAAEGLLDGLARRGDAAFLLRLLPEGGATAAAFREACAATGRKIVRIDSHERAALSTDAAAEDYLTESLSSKKLKELRRQLRRLGDEAPVTFREARSEEDVTAALERFLKLETLGWKGENGSAMASNPDQLGFVRALFAARAAKGSARVIELCVGEETAAAGLVLTGGRQAWFYKIAYDERYSKCSPGVQLTIELTKRLIEDPSIDTVDSTAIANHPMIDHIWRERLALGDWMIAVRPRAASLFAIAGLVETSRRRARTLARDLYHRLKDR
ncbi:GNAT family N-acetyltransferase [Hansschlegelia quercus]|uniref:GNAT family N-acetyltransferase n=1 Tax=Hansschlegelia quercus TaxID=2528245 RepID=A0A4Q9GL69_9HYPH|nr:GNAT family N-acetyltransferase [Hansschlegelia quercus]TBN53444.1 GNAT family N-acetyltransferase [Hansschlegelia quercus]